MRYLSTYAIFLAAMMVFISCEQEDEILNDPGLDYFDISERSYIDYQVDSIFHDVPAGVQDTFSFQVRELIDTTFFDGEGRPTARLERYYRDDDSSAWVLRDVWVANRTSTRGEKVEENVRFVKMSFPVRQGEVWDGNAFNTLEEWEYTYSEVDVPNTISDIDYERTARIIQRDRSNLIESEYAEEVYAYGIGMVYKRIDTLKFSFEGGISQLSTGVELEMRAIDFGTLE